MRFLCSTDEALVDT